MSKLICKAVLFVIFPAAIIVGNWILSDYASRPGEQGDGVSDLRTVSFAGGLATACDDPRQALFIFYHPHCPCTTATIRNLERLAGRFAEPTQVWAIAFCPSATPESWVDSATTKRLVANVGASLLADTDGKIAMQFGAKTSGHVMLYNAQRQLTFSGGITPGRGHEGDCAASDDLLRSIHGEFDETKKWPVHGCPISREENAQS
ncbi:MAG: RedB [Pirellulaceae bacterium]